MFCPPRLIFSVDFCKSGRMRLSIVLGSFLLFFLVDEYKIYCCFAPLGYTNCRQCFDFHVTERCFGLFDVSGLLQYSRPACCTRCDCELLSESAERGILFYRTIISSAVVSTHSPGRKLELYSNPCQNWFLVHCL